MMKIEDFYQFKDQALLEQSFTHRSFVAENPGHQDNQRLEFFGDAVIQLASTRYLFDRYPDCQEGDLTKMRSALTRGTTLALLAQSIDLGSKLRRGKGEERSGARQREAVLEDAFEALCGAICLDSDFRTAEEVYLAVFEKNFSDPQEMVAVQNPKGKFQELIQKRFHELPCYELIEERGPEHKRHYVVEVSLRGKIMARGEGVSLKKAEMAAARIALDLLSKP